MNNKLRFSCLALILGISMSMLCGCINRNNYNIASKVNMPARAHIAASQWLKGSSVFKATAMVTHYNDNGTPRLSRQDMEINVNSSKISASCALPDYKWWAKTTLASDFNPLGASMMIANHMPVLWGKNRSEVTSTLETILHRVRGPINFCDKETVSGVEPVFAAGYSTWRLDSEGSDKASAYFFSTEDGSLKLLTQGGKKATDKGTVTIYTLGYDAKGAVVPTAFEIVEIGNNSIIGQRKILSVSFENIVTK